MTMGIKPSHLRFESSTPQGLPFLALVRDVCHEHCGKLFLKVADGSGKWLTANLEASRIRTLHANAPSATC